MASPTNIRAPRMGAGDLAGTAAAFELRIPSEAIRRLAIGWLALGIAALLGAGLFSILLVLARTPAIAAHLPGVEFFRVALVTHVDLSVLVWFASFAGVLWTIGGPANRTRVGWGALALAAIGTLAMAVAPFIGNGRPIMANYIPVLDTPMFLGGLALFAIAFMAMAARALVHTDGLEQSRQPLGIGLDATALAAIAAGMTLIWSWVGVPGDLPSAAYFEMLFWGPGHVLQFVWTLMMLVAWVWLANRGGIGSALQGRMVTLAFVVATLPVLAVPLIYLAWPVTSIEHHKMLTWLMRSGGGLAIPILLAALTIGFARRKQPSPTQAPLRAALAASIGLFCFGGAIGFMIQGSDVRIPAHYHGSIVGVTLALIGLTYALLPQLGFRAPEGRLALTQPYLYAGGQLLHIVGLLWSGGYGVQRKVAGADQVLRSTGEILGMGLMGLGGLLAIAGGLAFILVVWRACRSS